MARMVGAGLFIPVLGGHDGSDLPLRVIEAGMVRTDGSDHAHAWWALRVRPAPTPQRIRFAWDYHEYIAEFEPFHDRPV
jgi:hypothetical protein